MQVEGRAADDLEHIAGRGLVFERFLEVAGALLQFTEQPRVLDRDDRLVGEGANQLDLPLGERLDPLPRQSSMIADRLALAQQRYAKRVRTLPTVIDLGSGVFRVGGDIGDQTTLPSRRAPAGNRPARSRRQ